MASLETKTAYVVGFYRPKAEDERLAERVNALRGWLEASAETYAYIVHDLDTSEDGERITGHVHFVYKAKECRRLSTNLKEIADALGVDPLAVSVDKATSVAASMRYLIHKDDPQKHQYPLGNVVHNWKDDEFQRIYAAREKKEIDFDYLLSLVRRSRNVTEVISVIGLGAYRYWRPVINDMWKDAHKGE